MPDPHTPFILAAYAVSASVMMVLVIWVALDYRAQRRALAELEAQGMSRDRLQ